MVRYSSSVLAAANLLALAQALPAQPVCSVVVQVVTGYGVWVPQPDPTWGTWAAPSSKTPVASSTAQWDDWSDPSKPKPTTKATTAAWSDWEDPFKYTKTTTAAWSDWEDPSKPKPTSKTTTAAWSDWEDPSKYTKTTTAAWSDWEDPSKYTKTTTAAWSDWEDPSKPKPTSKTTTTGWSDWEDPSKKTSTTASEWVSWTTSASAKPTSATTTKNGGGFYTQPTSKVTTESTTAAYTTPVITTPVITTPATTPSTTPATTPSTTASTTSSAAPAPTCLAYPGDSTFSQYSYTPGGSCGSTFQVDCHAKVYQSSLSGGFQSGSTGAWQQKSGDRFAVMDDCMALCDSNSACQAVLWVSDPSSGDFQKCYQWRGLPQPDQQGGDGTSANIAYKQGGSGCTENYSDLTGSPQ